MFTKYGYNTIGIVAIICFFLVVVSILVENQYYKYGLILISVIFIALTLNFFRDPDRISPEKEGIIVSPADGKIILVKEVSPDRYIEGDAWQISIFMSPLDVHVNRIPANGIVEYLKYVKGDFLTAFNDKADEKNERYEIGIKGSDGKLLFTQVAGFLARRIVNELIIGDSVKIGERFGMIKFGSRVDVIVNKTHKPLVKEGQRVAAGETILFEKI